ncbi:MAG: hypothetical protein ACNA8W_12980 [Bradymonadaceae bacterium]
MRTLTNYILLVFVLGSLFTFAQPVAAQETVTVQIRSIAASTKGESFDSRLNDLKRNLERGFAGYTSFEQVAVNSFSLSEKGSNSVDLPNGSTLTMTFHGKAGQFINLGLAIGDRLNTTLRATPGSTFFQAGLNYRDGILILAITVK